MRDDTTFSAYDPFADLVQRGAPGSANVEWRYDATRDALIFTALSHIPRRAPLTAGFGAASGKDFFLRFGEVLPNYGYNAVTLRVAPEE